MIRHIAPLLGRQISLLAFVVGSDEIVCLPLVAERGFLLLQVGLLFEELFDGVLERCFALAEGGFGDSVAGRGRGAAGS
jgi:hypothetical protein